MFGFLWVRDLMGPRRHAVVVSAPPPRERATGAMPRSKFLEASTLGLGAVIGGLVTVPAVGFAIVPPFLKQGRKDVDLGPLENFPEGKWVLARFALNPEHGGVSERTAFVRYNGQLEGQPSYTILSNRCAHLGCPVQPNGPLEEKTTEVEADEQRVMLQQAQAVSGFSCPCHGGAYDNEGNRTAGPPVRALDRYEFSIRRGRLFLGKAFSVGSVTGSGARAKFSKHKLAAPGVHVEGWEKVLYPLNPPSG